MTLTMLPPAVVRPFVNDQIPKVTWSRSHPVVRAEMRFPGADGPPPACAAAYIAVLRSWVCLPAAIDPASIAFALQALQQARVAVDREVESHARGLYFELHLVIHIPDVANVRGFTPQTVAGRIDSKETKRVFQSCGSGQCIGVHRHPPPLIDWIRRQIAT